MSLWRRIALVLVPLCISIALVSPTTAQDDTCSAVVQQALADVDQGCAATGRNQACYGFVSLDATPREDAQDFLFDKQGDLANVADIDTLRLSALDVENDQWGIALLKLQANLPDSLPGQNVTFLLFGDVEIENAVAPADDGAAPAEITATTTGGANIRSAPTTTAQVAGSLAGGAVVTVNGRNADSTWLRIQIPDSGSLGWVSASLLRADGDVSTLGVVEGMEAVTPFTPMQAFYFRTGITGTTCADAPADGILIQTPEGAGQITLRANDVDIQLGSTAFFQAIPGAQMTVSVVEGEGEATADGATVTIPAGTQVTIPVDENMAAAGEPSDAQPYDPSLVANLPVQALPRQIEIAEPREMPDATPTVPPGADDPFAGMPPGMFCMMMSGVLSQQGMSNDEYRALMEQALAMAGASGYGFSANEQADIDRFMAMLAECE